MTDSIEEEFSFDVGYVLDPSVWVIRSLMPSRLVLDNDVRLLVSPQVKAELEREFTAVSQLAELQSNGEIHVRVIEDSELVNANVLVTENAVGSYITTGEDELFVGSDEIETGVFFAYAKELWDVADTVSFSSPTETEVFRRVVTTFSRDVYRDFWELNKEIESHGIQNQCVSCDEHKNRTYVYMALIVSGGVNEVSMFDMIEVISDLWEISESEPTEHINRLVDENIIDIREGGVLMIDSSMKPVSLDDIVSVLSSIPLENT